MRSAASEQPKLREQRRDFKTGERGHRDRLPRLGEIVYTVLAYHHPAACLPGIFRL
jgi:hypothetical protein